MAAPSYSQVLQVGVAEVDITPPVGFRAAGGYGEVISTGVHDQLIAKAIVLRQGKTSAVIVMNDLLSVPAELSGPARRQLSKSTGIPADNIIIAATHNHGSPEYWGSLRDTFHDEAMRKVGRDPHEPVNYHRQLAEAWSAVVESAINHRRDAAISVHDAQQSGLAFNRRFHMNDGSVRFNPGVGNPQIIRPAGPVDDALPVLLFREDSGQQKPFASLTTFAMHTAVFGGSEFGADFPGVLQSQLRKHFGNQFVSLFAEGTAGDINHIDVQNPNSLSGFAESRRIGNAISDTIVKSLDQQIPIESPSLAVARHTEFVSFDPLSESAFRKAKATLLLQTSQRVSFNALVRAWRDCHRYRYTTQFPDGRKPLEVQGIRLDADTAIVALPHEVFVEIGLAIKASSPFNTTIVISLANDVDFYIPTRKAFAEGSYEVDTCPFDVGCGEILLDAAKKVLQKLKAK